MKTNKIKALILWVFLINSLGANLFAAGYDATADVNENWASIYSDDLADKRVHDTTLVEAEESGSDREFRRTYEQNRAGVVEEAEKWFKDVAYSTCESPIDYICPPLDDLKLNLKYRPRLNYVDLKNGEISCSVLRPLSSENNQLTRITETPVYKKTFINQACVSKYSIAKNGTINEEIEKLIKSNNEYIRELNQQEFKYTVDYSLNGDDKFLDLADTVTALVTFNPEVFDFEQTLLTRELKTRNNFTLKPNDTVIDRLEQSFTDIGDILFSDGFSGEEFNKSIQERARIRDLSSSMANSNYYMVLDFYLKSNELFGIVLGSLAIVFVGYNLIFTWFGPAIGNKIMKKDSGENNVHRGVYAFFIAVMFFSSNVEKLQVAYQDYDGNIQSTINVSQSRIQTAAQFLFTQTNWLADKLAEIGIRANSNALNASSGLLNGDQIEAMAIEKNILIKEKERLAEIDTQMCVNNYDLFELTQRMKKYRDKTLNKNAQSDFTGNNSFTDKAKRVGNLLGGSYREGNLSANTYPMSEREANAMMYYYGQSSGNNSSPYNSINGSGATGVVKSGSYPKFTSSHYSPLSLSGCYNNKKNMIINNNRIKDIESKLNAIADDTQKQGKVELMRVVNEIQWKNYATIGYPAIAFQPVVNHTVKNLGIVGDLKSSKERLESNIDGNDEALMLKEISKALPTLAIFGGYQIAKIVKDVRQKLFGWFGSILTKNPIGAVTDKLLSFGGDDDKVHLIDYYIAYLLIDSSLEVMVIAFITVGALTLFTLIFIEILFSFIALMFVVIFIFSKNQEERVTEALTKIIVVAFKAPLVVVCVCLCMFSINILDNFALIFVNDFFGGIDQLENEAWRQYDMLNGDISITSILGVFIKKYAFYGITSLCFQILAIILAVQILWKFPSFIVEILHSRISTAADSVTDSMMNTAQSQTVKV